MERDDDLVRRDRKAVSSAAGLVVAVVVLAFGAWLLQQSTAHPLIGFLGALLDATVAVLGSTVYRSRLEQALTPVLVLLGDVLRFVNPSRLLALFGPHKKPIILATSALVLVLAVAAILSYGRGGSTEVAFGCPHPAELRVLTSVDSVESTKDLLRAYERSTADRNDDCPTVHPFVYSAATSSVTDLLASGWSAQGGKDPLIGVGPRPDLWLPDSTVDVRAVMEVVRRGQLPKPIRTSASIGSSPMVIASRAPLSGVPRANPKWSQVMASVLSDQAGVLAPDPQTSTIALFALASYLRGDNGPVGLTEARRREQTVSASGGIAREDSVALLCRFGRDAEQAGSGNPVIITNDQLWQRYREGSLLGDSCAGSLSNPEDGSVIAPADTLVLDHPLVDFTWGTTNQHQSVAGFRDWLSSSTGAAALKAVHLGPPRTDCSTLDRQSIADPCVRTDLDAVLDAYHAAQQPGLVLLAVDTSGSMQDRVAVNGPTRFTVAAAAVLQALGQIGPQDQFGLWMFPPRPGSSGQLVKLGVGDTAQRDAVGAALKDVHPQGETPLYTTMVAGLKEAAAASPASHLRSLVVLTDGQDSSSHMTLEDTATQVAALSQATGVRLFVVATGEATCEGTQDLRALTDAGHGQCYEAAADQIAGTTAELFESLWKGQ